MHRASFREWPCASRTLPAVQGDHELVGGTQERMQNVTSQRHDFVTKWLPEAERQRATGPAETIGTNCGSGACAMVGKTTTADAFGIPCTDGRRPLARPSTATWSQGPNLLMAKETETSSSYQQWRPLRLRTRLTPTNCFTQERTITICNPKKLYKFTKIEHRRLRLPTDQTQKLYFEVPTIIVYPPVADLWSAAWVIDVGGEVIRSVRLTTKK